MKAEFLKAYPELTEADVDAAQLDIGRFKGVVENRLNGTFREYFEANPGMLLTERNLGNVRFFQPKVQKQREFGGPCGTHVLHNMHTVLGLLSGEEKFDEWEDKVQSATDFYCVLKEVCERNEKRGDYREVGEIAHEDFEENSKMVVAPERMTLLPMFTDTFLVSKEGYDERTVANITDVFERLKTDERGFHFFVLPLWYHWVLYFVCKNADGSYDVLHMNSIEGPAFMTREELDKFKTDFRGRWERKMAYLFAKGNIMSQNLQSNRFNELVEKILCDGWTFSQWLDCMARKRFVVSFKWTVYNPKKADRITRVEDLLSWYRHTFSAKEFAQLATDILNHREEFEGMKEDIAKIILLIRTTDISGHEELKALIEQVNVIEGLLF